jgi:hypothetical protein
LTQAALEEDGIAVLALDADMVDAANWNHEVMTQKLQDFLVEMGLQ